MPVFSRETKRAKLSRPRGGVRLGVHYDPQAFGEFSEAVARFLGTGRFLFFQTVMVIIWITMNVALVSSGHAWDKYPFILLNLAFSTQAAYAAPLILLAQNRQAERDRSQAEFDRQVSQRTQAEAEFLARELASVRISLSDNVSTEDLDRAVERIMGAMERQRQQDRDERNNEES